MDNANKVLLNSADTTDDEEDHPLILPRVGSYSDLIMKKPSHLLKAQQNELNQMSQSSLPTNTTVKFNVGGRNYIISHDLLMSFPDCKLTKIATGEILANKDQNGAFIIDRNDKYFNYVIDFLRNSGLNLTDVDKKSRQSIRDDLLYYTLLHHPQKKKKKIGSNSRWKWDANIARTNKITLSKRRTQAVANASDQGLLIGDMQFKEDVHVWRIKIGNLKGNVPFIAMGVLNKQEPNLWLENLFRFSYTWGITTDGDKLISGDKTQNSPWLMENGDQILFKYDAQKHLLYIRYSKLKETITIDGIHGEIFPFVFLMNPFDYVTTNVL